MDDTDDISTIERCTAQSGRLDYSTPTVIHESSVMRQSCVPFYVARSSGADSLSIRLQTERKTKRTPWIINEKKSITLNEPAARKLLATLQKYFALAEQGKRGKYAVINLEQDAAFNLGEHEPQAVSAALLRALADPKVQEHVRNAELGTELAGALRGAIRLSEMRGAVVELKNKLEQQECEESIYQDWCERHTWAFGNAYVMRDDVRSISSGDQLDLLLPTVISGYRDIVELKRPDMSVLNWDKIHKNYYFASPASKAIGQCYRYLDVLHEVAAKGLRDNPEVVAYHPRATIVIGRSSDWKSLKLKALHGLNRRLVGVTLMTYDQLLAQGERLLQMFSVPEDDSEDDTSTSWPPFDANDDEAQ